MNHHSRWIRGTNHYCRRCRYHILNTLHGTPINSPIFWYCFFKFMAVSLSHIFWFFKYIRASKLRLRSRNPLSYCPLCTLRRSHLSRICHCFSPGFILRSSLSFFLLPIFWAFSFFFGGKSIVVASIAKCNLPLSLMLLLSCSLCLYQFILYDRDMSGKGMCLNAVKRKNRAAYITQTSRLIDR